MVLDVGESVTFYSSFVVLEELLKFCIVTQSSVIPAGIACCTCGGLHLSLFQNALAKKVVLTFMRLK